MTLQALRAKNQAAMQLVCAKMQLKSFYEEGEREVKNEQIMVLENKLLEAPDWKLMHEADMTVKTNSDSVMEEAHADGNLTSKEVR
ncbi:hypothetical protein K1719_003004 [Acacia pycnantha]|nr:hypothetical protein K1719_003004 [Acacia pycnantha]